MQTTKIQNLVNHVVLVVDQSTSMKDHRSVEDVVDKELNSLKARSKQNNQETRISIYLFSYTREIECLVFDMDVMRFETMKGLYHPNGNTALIDATLKAIVEHKEIPQKYGDHAFLVYVITDGEENNSNHGSTDLSKVINGLPENWTVACLVPDQNGVFEAKKFGFPANCISIWDTKSAQGFEEVGNQFSRTMDSYMTMRSTGQRGTKGLFTMDSSNLNQRGVLKPVTFGYQIFNVMKDGRIDETVKEFTHRPYSTGSTFYQPTKAVKVQDYKDILVQNIQSKQVFGGEHIRQALGLPDNTVEVNPGQHKDWRIFIQSTSVNRKLFANTLIIVKNNF